ncbi:hypothetical protein CFOL_v3_09578, partial [Cephalotus follicularis]
IFEVMQGNETRCFNMFKMEKHVFVKLINKLQSCYGLKVSRRMSALEMVAIFANIASLGCSNRAAQERFQHSCETASRVFDKVLDSVCKMAIDIIRPADPSFKDIPMEILNDSRYMPHFKMKLCLYDYVYSGCYYKYIINV